MLRRSLPVLLVTVGALTGVAAPLALADQVATDTTAGPAAATSDRLMSGQSLTAGQSLRSDNDNVAVMQTDGNFVVYSASNQVLFNTGTSGAPDADVVMQTDGNLVVYSHGRALWYNNAAVSVRGGGPATLIMQTDGNLVEYINSTAPIWASDPPRPPAGTFDTLTVASALVTGQQLTASNNGYRFAVQSDGNVVATGPGGVMFATGTWGHTGAYLLMQTDGNLVAYGPGALWQSGTSGRGGTRLVMQADGTLVLYSDNDVPVWVAPRPPVSTTPAPVVPPVQRGIVGGDECAPAGAVGYDAANRRFVCYPYGDGEYVWLPA